MPASEAADKPIPSSMDDTRQELIKAKRGRRWGLWVLGGLVILVPLAAWGGLILWRKTDLKPGDSFAYVEQGEQRRRELLRDVLDEPNRWEELMAIGLALRGVSRSLRNAPGEFDAGYVDWMVFAYPEFRVERYAEGSLPPPESHEYKEHQKAHEHTLGLTTLAAEQAVNARILEQFRALRGSRHVLRPDAIQNFDPSGASELRSEARFLAGVTHLALRDADDQRAEEALGTLFWLGEAACTSGVLAEFISGEGIRQLAIRTAAQVAMQSPSLHSSLASLVDKHEVSPAGYLAIDLDRFHQLAMYQPMYTDDGDGEGRFIGGTFFERLQNLDSSRYPGKSEVFGLINDYYDQLLQAASTPAPDRLRQLRTFSRPSTKMILDTPVIISPVLPSIVLYDPLHEERLELLRTLVAIERHRSAHGRLPHSLENLVPEFLSIAPTSPFVLSGGIHYEIDPAVTGGYWLWGVGVDGENDNGHAEGGFGGMWPGTDQILLPEHYQDYPSRGDGNKRVPELTAEDFLGGDRYSVFHKPPDE